MQKKYFEEEDEEFVEMNISPKLLEIVPVLFKTEPEVTVFYDGFIEKVESNKHLRKNEDNREIMDKAFLDELLKYHYDSALIIHPIPFLILELYHDVA